MIEVKFELYGTDGCHLCELAEHLLAEHLLVEVDQLAVAKAVSKVVSKVIVKRVDIIDDERLVEAYGTTIPVIKNTQSGFEMNWPFDAAQLVNFLSS
ncbi:MAG: glutaredoxin family protein [Psychrosphaera sp.]|nr:glutaredoxin family protein [Psychrosphaera sp.]